MTQGGNIFRAGERRLLDAIRAGEVCDFTDGAEITAEQIASWGPERTVRATLLCRLVTAENAAYATTGIRLRGAAVEGILDLQGLNVVPLDLGQCRIAAVQAEGATFTGDAWFGGATFTGDAHFSSARFSGRAWFGGATFTGDARFISARFSGRAGFNDAAFTRGAEFVSATFTDPAGFDGATFTDLAWFASATFTGEARFDGTNFAGRALFAGATFTSAARFVGATFTDLAAFDGATFTRRALFDGATFTGKAEFTGAMANAYDFSRAQFHVTDPGPWVARRVTLAGAVFHVRARVGVAAVEVDCRRLQAREGVHLLVRGGAVDLEDAEFLRRSILAHSVSEPSVPEREDPGERPEGFDDLPLPRQARWTAQEQAFRLAQQLAAELGSQKLPRTQVISLRRATAGDLVLSGVGLEDCAFAGGHGLDKLRIDATCSFQRPPAWSWHTWRRFTGRRVILEEVQWRQTHTPGWAPTTTADASAELDGSIPTALEIAGIYRDLRKGLEDAKDEPGAADFYYGEMEMRRLAARKIRPRPMWIGLWKAISKPVVCWNKYRGLTRMLGQSWTERRLLDAYWAVSGYGLRAWRALTALTVLLVGCAALFTRPAFVKLPPDHFATSLEFSARESLTLIRVSGDPLLKTIGIGTVLDIALRLLAPLLLGLALLAVRGRTKR